MAEQVAVILGVAVAVLCPRHAHAGGVAAAAAAAAVRSEPYVDGVGGYHTYRIPSLIATADGDLLLFVEGALASSA